MTERLVAGMIFSVCLLMTLAVGTFLLQSRSRVLERTRGEAATLAESVEQHAERSIQEVDLALRAAREALRTGSSIERVASMAGDYARWLPQVECIIMLDIAGRTLVDPRPPGTAGTPGEAEDRFRALLLSVEPGLTFGAPFADPATGQWRMTLSRPLRADDGALIGIVGALVRLEQFASFYRSLSFSGPTIVIGLLDGETRLLVRHPERPDLVGVPLPDRRTLDAAIEPGRVLEMHDLEMLDGGNRHAYVHQVGRLPLFALVGIDESALLSQWRRDVAAFGAVLLVLIVTTVWLGWLGVQQMARARESQRAVVQQAGWLDATIQSIDQGITVFDEQARLVTWNRNAELLLGVPPGELQAGMHFMDAMRDSARRGEHEGLDVERLARERLAAALDGKAEVYDQPLRGGRVIEVRRTSIASGGFVSTYRDVSAEREAARDLQQRAEILRILHAITQAANEAPDLASAMRRILHLIADGAGWPVAVAHRLRPGPTPVFAPVYWYLADRERFEPFRTACAVLQFGPAQGLSGAVLDEGKPIFVDDLATDARFLARDEAAAVGLRSAFAVPVLERRRVVGTLVFFSDRRFAEDYFLFAVLDSISAQISRVAERERSEANLKARELRLRSIFDNVDDGLFTINESGGIESMNPAAERVFGVRADDALRRDIRKYIDGGEVRFAGVNVIERLARATAAGPLSDLLGRRADGTLFPIELTAKDMHLEDNRRAVVVVRDISERRRVERMKNEFVSTVSHELRTPLTSIAGSLGLLAGGVAGELPPRAKQLVEIARSNSSRLVLLINDILDLEKIEAGRMEFKPREIDLVELARQAIEANRSYAEKYSVEYRLHEPRQRCQVVADPDRIMQVFNNLLSNAAKFSPAGTAVEVSVAVPTATRVRVEVVDHGSGIPEAFRAAIFEKFSQADSTDARAKGGSGLGLSIVKSILERSGGKVGFNSAEGAGTTFWFELPAAQPDVQDLTDIDGAAFVGDALCLLRDEAASEKITRTLVTEGFAAERHSTLASLRDALERGRPDILVIDLDIAGRDGIDFVHALRNQESTRDIPVIPISTLSASQMGESGGAALTLGDWMEVPVDEQRLVEAIRTVIQDDIGKVRVLHVEDDPDIVEVVRLTLRGAASVHSVPSLARARALLAEETFDVVLLDLELEDGNGAELIPALAAARTPAMPVILFSASEAPAEIISQVAESLLKSKTSLDALRKSIGNVARRGRRAPVVNPSSV